MWYNHILTDNGIEKNIDVYYISAWLIIIINFILKLMLGWYCYVRIKVTEAIASAVVRYYMLHSNCMQTLMIITLFYVVKMI